MVQVFVQWRQRQQVSTVMILASVSILLPLQKGHTVGRAGASLVFPSRMRFCSFR
jgi:hypothetical protein